MYITLLEKRSEADQTHGASWKDRITTARSASVPYTPERLTLEPSELVRLRDRADIQAEESLTHSPERQHHHEATTGTSGACISVPSVLTLQQPAISVEREADSMRKEYMRDMLGKSDTPPERKAGETVAGKPSNEERRDQQQRKEGPQAGGTLPSSSGAKRGGASGKEIKSQESPEALSGRQEGVDDARNPEAMLPGPAGGAADAVAEDSAQDGFAPQDTAARSKQKRSKRRKSGGGAGEKKLRRSKPNNEESRAGVRQQQKAPLSSSKDKRKKEDPGGEQAPENN
ncbi:hypothetical protein V5799_006994 [Amblyomma americanum]|uniref:Uncharacterized protein n=1 Tax=Amblyomma americanum TaxID=6943 RepID=A0AAQ4DUT4_AMBAM